MKIGFSVGKDGEICANAVTDAETLEIYDTEIKGSISQDEKAVALLDFADRKTNGRGNMGDAFEMLRLLIGVNHFYDGSVCYAIEEMCEEIFAAGRAYERTLRVETPIS